MSLYSCPRFVTHPVIRTGGCVVCLAILMERHQFFVFVGHSFTAGSVVLPPSCGGGVVVVLPSFYSSSSY